MIDQRSPRSYYFMCKRCADRLAAVTLQDGENHAYCCGGVRSAVTPLRTMLDRLGVRYEFSIDTQGISSGPAVHAEAAMIGDTVVDLGSIKPMHPGGGGVIDRTVHGVKADACPMGGSHESGQASESMVDLTDLFLQLHPHPYNLLRCLGQHYDLEYSAFVDFIEAEAARGVIVDEAAHAYAMAALDHPDRLDLVRAVVTLELRALHTLDPAGKRSLQSKEELRRLLAHLPGHEPLSVRAVNAVGSSTI